MMTMIWSFDRSGSKKSVRDALEAATYDSLVQAAKDYAADLAVLKRISGDVARLADREAANVELQALLADPVERRAYDRARAYVIGEVDACESDDVGVTMRSLLDFADTKSPHVRVHVDVTEY